MKYDAKYGLPSKVIFCKKCVMSNQRPGSTPEFKHVKDSKKVSLHIDSEGVCDACRANEQKNTISWKMREEELLKLLDKYRKNDGSYDCIIPGSGGKDSVYQSHVLKYKYGMNPLTVTWPPILYTDYGYINWKNWINIGGFDNISFNYNGGVMKKLTRLSIENLLHPFQTFILGQKNLAPKIAKAYGINLIFYGENEAEYGNPLADNSSSLREKSFYSYQSIDDMYVGGVSVKELKERHGLSLNDLKTFLPMSTADFEGTDIQVHYLGYYLRWTPQEVYYYSVENTDFRARPFRSQGTYSKYNSIDDKIDDLHYYTTFIKFGIGRATYDASQEIRNNHISREEAVYLVKKYDGEFPDRYFKELMSYLEIPEEKFMEYCDQARSPHLWGKDSAGSWKRRHTVWGGGLDD